MTMRRSDVPPPRPEDADSWGEFNARLEQELAGRCDPLAPLWWSLAGVLFATGLIFNLYATQERSWAAWVCMLAAFGVVVVMAVRALDRADRNRARAAELARLQEAWSDRLDRHSPAR